MRGLAFAVVALVVVAPARADEDSPEKQQARMLLSQGNQLFEKGDLRAALADFRAAYALYPSPKLLVNAAAAERELGDLAGAATDLRHFLDDATEDESALLDKARGDLRALERKVGRIALTGWPQKSSIEVDGHSLRDPAYVKPGEHHVKARTPAGGEVERDLSVAAGESVEVGPPPPAPAPLVGNGPGVEQKKKSRWWVPVVVTTVIVAAGGLATGLALGLTQQPQPLKGDLGAIKFSDFH